MFIRAVTNDLRIGDNATLDGSASGKGYALVAAGKTAEIDCANGNSIYALQNIAAVSMHFYFTVMEV